MTIADIQISKYKLFVLTEQRIYKWPTERAHLKQTGNIKTMTISEGNDLCKISKHDWARVLQIENQTLEKCSLLLSNIWLPFNVRTIDWKTQLLFYVWLRRKKTLIIIIVESY